MFVSFGEIPSGRCTDTVPQRRIHVRSWQVVSAAAKRRLGFVRLDLYGASIAPLESLLDENRILTHIDVLIVPSVPLHFPSCLLRIMERRLTVVEQTYSTSYDNHFHGHPTRNYLLINRPPHT